MQQESFAAVFADCSISSEMCSGITQAKKGRSAAGSVASKAKKGGNPLSGVSNPLSGDGDAKKAGKSIASKASKTASKAGAKVANSPHQSAGFFCV